MRPADMDAPGPGHGQRPGNESVPAGGPLPDAALADSAATPPGGAVSGAGTTGSGSSGSEAPGAVSSSSEAPAAVDPGAGASGGRDPRPGRKKKIIAWTATGVAVVLLLALGAAYAVYRHLNGNLHQLDISGELGSQPVNLHPQAENVMIIGSDTRNGQGRGFGQGITTDRSDTLMILHIAADRKWADVMSIPRDSWVNIPSCKMGNGQMSAPTTFKINEAYTLGTLHGNHTDLGVACTIKTLEQDTGIHIDHFVVVNFAGFRDMVNAVGGVEECNTTAINDPLSGLHLSAGHHLLHGWEALAYVRARYTLGNGSDLERIGRQQAFMSSLVTKVKSKLLNPVAIYNFLNAATKAVTIDSQLGGLHGLYNLAMSVRNLPARGVTFFTLPTYPRELVDPTDTANVLWTQPADSVIFQDFRDNIPVSSSTLRPAQAPKISPSTVSVSVRNGTPQYGLQDSVASLLRQRGFKVTSTAQESTRDVTETIIKYHAGSEAQARLLAAKVPGSAIQQVPGTGPQLILVLGSDYGTTAHASGGAQGTTPTPSPSFSSRTATQNICAS